jgi:hypothetical protein
MNLFLGIAAPEPMQKERPPPELAQKIPLKVTLAINPRDYAYT